MAQYVYLHFPNLPDGFRVLSVIGFWPILETTWKYIFFSPNKIWHTVATARKKKLIWNTLIVFFSEKKKEFHKVKLGESPSKNEHGQSKLRKFVVFQMVKQWVRYIRSVLDVKIFQDWTEKCTKDRH